MKQPDAPLPQDVRGVEKLSLEQLLSLPAQNASARRVETGPKPGLQGISTNASVTTDAVEPGVADASQPLLLVVYEHAAAPSSLQQKMLCLRGHARVHWLSMQEQVKEKIALMHPDAVIIEFAPNSLDLAIHLAAEIRGLESGIPISALGNTSDSQCMFAALRAGVKDFLDIDVPDPVWLASVKDLLLHSSTQGIGSAGNNKQLIAIISARAGVGTSLLATHLAVFSQELAKRQSDETAKEALHGLLLDLGAPYGDGALYLDVGCEFDFFDAMQSLRRFDKQLASTGLSRHVSGLRSISMTKKAWPANGWADRDVDVLLQRLQQYFQQVFVDLGGCHSPALISRIAQHAQKIFLVCDQSLASVVESTELLRLLEEKKVDRSRIELIVSRYDKKLDLDARQIARQLKLSLTATVPEHRTMILQATNQGNLLSQKKRRDPYVQVLHALAKKLATSMDVSNQSKSFWGTGFFNILKR